MWPQAIINQPMLSNGGTGIVINHVGHFLQWMSSQLSRLKIDDCPAFVIIMSKDARLAGYCEAVKPTNGRTDGRTAAHDVPGTSLQWQRSAWFRTRKRSDQWWAQRTTLIQRESTGVWTQANKKLHYKKVSSFVLLSKLVQTSKPINF